LVFSSDEPRLEGRSSSALGERRFFKAYQPGLFILDLVEVSSLPPVLLSPKQAFFSLPGSDFSDSDTPLARRPRLFLIEFVEPFAPLSYDLCVALFFLLSEELFSCCNPRSEEPANKFEQMWCAGWTRAPPFLSSDFPFLGITVFRVLLSLVVSGAEDAPSPAGLSTSPFVPPFPSLPIQQNSPFEVISPKER